MKTIELKQSISEPCLVGEFDFPELDLPFNHIEICEYEFRWRFPQRGETIYIDIQNHYAKGFTFIPTTTT